MGPKNSYYPACLIAFLIAVLFGICSLCQLYLLKDSYPLLTKLPVGQDYLAVFKGTQALVHGFDSVDQTDVYYSPDIIMKGLSPYASYGYLYPPVAAYLNYPFWLLGVETAQRFMFFFLIVAVISAYGLINTSFQNFDKKDRKINFLFGVVIILLSLPFYYLIVRGHMIGITFLLLAAGIYLLKKNNFVSGICFGLSIGMFLFPVLILVPLLLFRRYKIIFCTMVTLLLLFFLCPEFWVFYFEKIISLRVVTRDTFSENCSLANTFNYFYIFFNTLMAKAGIQFRIIHYNEAAFAVYGLMFSAMVLVDHKIRKKFRTLDMNIELALTLMYCPFMIAFPPITFPYVLVLLLFLVPAVGSLASTLKQPMPKIIFWLFVSGIVLSQMQAQSFQSFFNPQYELFYFFPTFGLFLVMTGCVFFKIWFLFADKARTAIITRRNTDGL